VNGLSEVWCAKCDQPAVTERRQADGETVAHCHEHDLEAQWKANSPSWKGAK
jgi:hypothetical protein